MTGGTDFPIYKTVIVSNADGPLPRMPDQGNLNWEPQVLKIEVLQPETFGVCINFAFIRGAILGHSRCYLGVKITQDRAGRARLGTPCRARTPLPGPCDVRALGAGSVSQ